MKLNERVEAIQISNPLNSASVSHDYDVTVRPNHLHTEEDLLVQFRTNIAQIEDLSGRLQFVLNEVQGVLKKR